MSLLRLLPALLLVLAVDAGCARTSADAPSQTADEPAAPAIDPAVADTATFAGGCFWCMEPPFDKLDGVSATVSGYAGGSIENPSYEQVATGGTGHAETVQIIYDSTKVDYERLLYVYWRNVDPLDGGGQFCDRGASYRPAIFVHNDRQRRLATQSKQDVAERFDAPLQVEIQPLDAFYRAEDYHQNYYQKNPAHYKAYRTGCGRDARLRELWGEEAGGLTTASASH